MARYQVIVDGSEYPVDVSPGGQPMIAGRSQSCEIRPVGENIFSVTIDGQSHTVVAARLDGAYEVSCSGVQHNVEVNTERGRLLKKYATAASRGAKRAEIHAPMPAMVIRVQVAPGDEVKEGDGLVILEAMKMENEIKAQHAGRVKSVHVEKGKAVEKGELLILME